MPIREHRIFRGVWWSASFLLVIALLGVIHTGGWEYSVRRYRDGFSDAIAPDSKAAERQSRVEAILDWMRKGPPRLVAADSSALREPAIFAQAGSMVPDYPKNYAYESFTHVRSAWIPGIGIPLRWMLDKTLPNWEEGFNWTLILERESLFALCASSCALLFLLLRFLLGWYADHRLNGLRFQRRSRFLRAGPTFLCAPEIK